MLELDGRVAVVTGASGGIGAAVARSLAEHGVRLGLASRSGADLGIDGAVAAPCDVRDASAVDAFVARVAETFGGIDILRERQGQCVRANWATRAPRGSSTSAKGTTTRPRRLSHHPKSDAADFVTVASEAGRRGLPFEAVYCASKFGQVGFTRAMDHELRPQGVRCTNVCPGGVATEFAMGRGRTPEMPELEGMMSAEDVAEAVLFVLTRPRNHRILEVAFRPVTETSWG
jgi:3-oxoacyl-[acyl-carrier protein] reductase